MLIRLIDDIQKALTNKCYFSALSLALTLPDICGMAEFSKEHPVAKRYIHWFDEHIGKYELENSKYNGEIITPYLSGEVIYNLRNTYLHQGCPTVTKSSIKNVNNQLDKFILVLSDGQKFFQSAYQADIGNGMMVIREFTVDVTYLCNLLCYAAEKYYLNNREKFKMEYHVVDEKEFLEL